MTTNFFMVSLPNASWKVNAPKTIEFRLLEDSHRLIAHMQPDVEGAQGYSVELNLEQARELLAGLEGAIRRLGG